MIEELWTLRGMEHQVFRQIIERWEDDVGSALGLRLVDYSRAERRSASRMGALLRRLDPSGRILDDLGRPAGRRAAATGLMFHVFGPRFGSYYAVQGAAVPVVIDWWRDSLAEGIAALRRCPVVVVTNRELEPELRAGGWSGALVTVPLAVEDAVLSLAVRKTVDLVQVGRQNAPLHAWALEYVAAHPEVDYVYADHSTGWPEWRSTRRGPLTVGRGRAEYLELLGSARVALVSAPGIDGGEKRTGGFNPVTPRFYEAAALGCQLVGRYPVAGADFVANGVATVCPHIADAAGFHAAVSAALAGAGASPAALRAFACDHSGSALAQRLRTGLSGHGLQFPAKS